MAWTPLLSPPALYLLFVTTVVGTFVIHEQEYTISTGRNLISVGASSLVAGAFSGQSSPNVSATEVDFFSIINGYRYGVPGDSYVQ
jgi:hypothetical protein